MAGNLSLPLNLTLQSTKDFQVSRKVSSSLQPVCLSYHTQCPIALISIFTITPTFTIFLIN